MASTFGDTEADREEKAEAQRLHMQLSAGTAKPTKLVYVKRWRTLVELPEKYADEIVQALRDEPQTAPKPGR
jgi:hypothetical protein